MKHIFFLIIAVSFSLVTVQQVYATHYDDIGIDDSFWWREWDEYDDASVNATVFGKLELPYDSDRYYWNMQHNSTHLGVLMFGKTFNQADIYNNTSGNVVSWEMDNDVSTGNACCWDMAIMEGTYNPGSTSEPGGFPPNANYGVVGGGGSCNTNPSSDWRFANGNVPCLATSGVSNDFDNIIGGGSFHNSINPYAGWSDNTPGTGAGQFVSTSTITNTEWIASVGQGGSGTITIIWFVTISDLTSTDHLIAPIQFKITNTDFGTLQWDFPDTESELDEYILFGGSAEDYIQLTGTEADYGFFFSHDPDVPAAPTNLFAVIDTSDIDLSWTAPVFQGYSPIIGYKIERESPIGGGFSTLVTNTGSTATTYSDTSIVVGTEYNYRVRTLNTYGESLPSNESKDGVPSVDVEDPNPNVTCPESQTEFLLEASVIGVTSVTLCWNGQNLPQANLIGYQGNSTTPWGNPLTIITGFNNTGTPSSTTKKVSNLSPATQYSFRVQAWQNGSMNNVTNIVNVTTLPNTFNIDDLNFGGETNLLDFDWEFARVPLSGNMTSLLVNYPASFNATCVFNFKFNPGASQTFSNISTVPITSAGGDARQLANFTLQDPDNEVIHVICNDEDSDSEGRFVLYQSSYPLLQQIAGFRAGDYGTAGNFGIFDFITMVVVLISMIGFNRVNSAVGGVFSIIVIGVASWFGFIQWYSGALMGAVVAIVTLAIFMHHRDDVTN
jgi:hypothetical protein